MAVGGMHDNEIGDIADDVADITSWCQVQLSVRRLKRTSAGSLSGQNSSNRFPYANSKVTA